MEQNQYMILTSGLSEQSGIERGSQKRVPLKKGGIENFFNKLVSQAGEYKKKNWNKEKIKGKTAKDVNWNVFMMWNLECKDQEEKSKLADLKHSL